MPLISVIIPTKNRCTLLSRAVNSVLSQTLNDFEVIIINDGSTDQTKQYLTSLESAKTTVINLSHSCGGGVSRNEGIKKATGKYLAFLDDDDTWEPTKLAEQLNIMRLHPPGICHTGINVYSKNKTFKKYIFKHPKFSDRFQSIMYNNFIGTTSSIMVSSTIAKKIEGFNPSLPALQDWDFYIRMLQTGCSLSGINKPLVNYFFIDTKQSVSLNAEKHKQAVQLMSGNYRDAPYFNLLKKALQTTTIMKSLKSWSFFINFFFTKSNYHH